MIFYCLTINPIFYNYHIIVAKSDTLCFMAKDINLFQHYDISYSYVKQTMNKH